MVKKATEIPVLEDYSKNAPAWFWEKFPNSNPESLKKQKLNVKNLKKLIQKCWFDWSPAQRETAKRALGTRMEGPSQSLKNLWVP